MSSAKIPDEVGNSAPHFDAPMESGTPSGESSRSSEALETSTVIDEAVDSNEAASAENEYDPTSPDEELLRYLFTIC